MIFKYRLILLAAIAVLGCSDVSKEVAAKSSEKPDPQSQKAVDLLEAVKDCDECPPMVLIPSLPESNAQLFVARHELTWREYLVAVESAQCLLPQILPNVSIGQNNLSKMSDDYPVSYLPPDHFECYLDWINEKTGQSYRLPTSDEWEHMARAGAKTRYPWGDGLGQENAAIYGHYDRNKYPRHRPSDPRFQSARNLGVVPVESFKPNAWGLYDVIGNVAEYLSERKEGPQNCKEKYESIECQLIAFRGGRIGSVAYQFKTGEPTRLVGHDKDHMGFIGWTFGRLGDSAAQPHGYRIVRN